MSKSPRRGARRPDDVPAEILKCLEAGEESANHMEQIAMDMGNLLSHQFPQCGGRADELRGLGLVHRMRAGGGILFDELGPEAVLGAGNWTSDTARGWAAMSIGHAPGLKLAERLDAIRPFADDPHFAVREWAWLSLRPHVAAEVTDSIALLGPWTIEDSPRLRRFASEVTRPRGVWSAHISLLKAEPDHSLSLLEPLRSDPSRYVQNSVANWLNDASKSRPDWVRATCETWLAGAPSPTTEWICRRGMRSITRAAASASGPGSLTPVL